MTLRFRLLTLVAIFCAAGAVRAADPPKGQRVFTAGHSFHMMIPGALAEIAKSAGIKEHAIAGTQGLGGSRTIQIWDLPEEKAKIKEIIRGGKVDVLTLSPHILLPDPGIDNFTKLCLESNADARILVQASWMPFDDWEKNKSGFKNDDRNNAKIDVLRKTYEPFDKNLHDQVGKLNKEYQEKYKRPVVFLVPVGQAVMNLREKVVAGKVPGIEKQADLFTDPIGHCKAPVSLLNAYCHYAVIYKQSPVGLPVPTILKTPRLFSELLAAAFARRAEELNKTLQETAWEAVTKDPASGER
jgi:hypothetical protein